MGLTRAPGEIANSCIEITQQFEPRRRERVERLARMLCVEKRVVPSFNFRALDGFENEIYAFNRFRGRCRFIPLRAQNSDQSHQPRALRTEFVGETLQA